MNLRARELKSTTYKEFAKTRLDDINAIIFHITGEKDVYQADTASADDILDYMYDIKIAFEKIVNRKLSWIEWEPYYKLAITKINEKLQDEKEFKAYPTYKKDVAIHTNLSYVLNITPPDEFLVNILKEGRKAERSTLKKEKEFNELQQFKDKALSTGAGKYFSPKKG